MSIARAIVADSILMLDLAEAAESAFAVDPQRRIVFWSPAAEDLLGFRPDDVMGRRCCDVLRASGGNRSGSNGSGSGSKCACGQCLRPGAKGSAVRLVSQFRIQVTAHNGRSKQLCVTAVRTHSAEGDVRIIHFMRELVSADLPRDASGEGQPGASDGASPEQFLAYHLTTRELEVLRLVAAGLRTAEIATALSISPITARNHITRVIEKLDVKTRLQAVIAASREGLI